MPSGSFSTSGGNKYRLVVKVWFGGQTIWIKFVGTHED